MVGLSASVRTTPGGRPILVRAADGIPGGRGPRASQCYPTSLLVFYRYIQVNLVKSSTIVRKYLKPYGVETLNEP